MANLIIKPQNTSGDKVIIQDQAGVAVLTTADSGATIANATLNSPTMVTPALGTPASGVVTNLSGVLPVGVTGGSGLTALASNPTVTLGSNATFPAGHVLQIKFTSGTGNQNSTGSYVSPIGTAYIQITKQAGTDIFLQWSAQFGTTNGQYYVHGTQMNRSTASNMSSATTIPSTPQVSNTDRPKGSAGYSGTSAYMYFGNYGHSTIDDTITSSAGTFYYQPKFKSNGGNVYANIDDGVCIFWAMEYKT